MGVPDEDVIGRTIKKLGSAERQLLREHVCSARYDSSPEVHNFEYKAP